MKEVYATCRLAHGDITANSNHLILNDWGSAATIGEETEFEGTMGFYDIPDDVILCTVYNL